MPANVLAQSIVTDRPDRTESAITVPKNSLQFETGFAYENLTENEYSVDNYTIAGTLIRYGLAEILELRFGTAYLITTSESTIEGLGNFLVGTKINFATEERNSFALGLLAHVILPIGNAAFNPPDTDPQIIAAISKSLSEKLSIAGNLGATYSSFIEIMIYNYTAALNLSISEPLGMFLEAFGEINSSYSPVHNIDGGFTYLISENFQIDISGGKELSGVESFWFFSIGLSFRFLNLSE